MPPSAKSAVAVTLVVVVVMAWCGGPRAGLVAACNEAVCASVVSKCTLLRSCDCQIEAWGCTCCKKCFACLEYLQADCCSCVGLCPAPNSTGAAATQKSMVADFEESVPQLWEALTAGDDPQARWHKFTFPVALPARASSATVSGNSSSSKADVPPAPAPSPSQPDAMCTVVYLSQCTAETKCQLSCRSMGAAAYRWFSDGCCECIGPTCINYGLNESRCEKCSFDDDDDDLSPDAISDEELERLERIYQDDLDTLDPEGQQSDDAVSPPVPANQATSASKKPKK